MMKDKMFTTVGLLYLDGNSKINPFDSQNKNLYDYLKDWIFLTNFTRIYFGSDYLNKIFILTVLTKSLFIHDLSTFENDLITFSIVTKFLY